MRRAPQVLLGKENSGQEPSTLHVHPSAPGAVHVPCQRVRSWKAVPRNARTDATGHGGGECHRTPGQSELVFLESPQERGSMHEWGEGARQGTKKINSRTLRGRAAAAREHL